MADKCSASREDGSNAETRHGKEISAAAPVGRRHVHATHRKPFLRDGAALQQADGVEPRAAAGSGPCGGALGRGHVGNYALRDRPGKRLVDFVEVFATKGSATKEQFAASARTTRSPSESARLSKPRVVASTGRRRTGTRRRFSPWAGTRPVGIAARLIAFGVFVLGAVPGAAQAADDYAANTSTTGTVVVGGSQTGEIESHGDLDWIRVTLVGGTRYVIDYDGSANGQGTLSDPYFHGVYDANGNLISGTTDSNGGLGLNSRIDFTPGSSGTYFLGLGNGAPSLTGTYRVSVTEFDDYVVEVIVPGDDYEGDITTTGSVSVGGSAVGNFQKARGRSDSDWIRTTTDSSIWYYLDHDWFRVTFDAGKTYRVLRALDVAIFAAPRTEEVALRPLPVRAAPAAAFRDKCRAPAAT